MPKSTATTVTVSVELVLSMLTKGMKFVRPDGTTTELVEGFPVGAQVLAVKFDRDHNKLAVTINRAASAKSILAKTTHPAA